MAPTRRTVLKATGAASITAALAGCTDSVPLVGGSSGPCSDAESLMEAAFEGDAEAAADYIPYEYMDDVSRDEAVAMYDMGDMEGFEEMLEEFDFDVSCESEEALSDDEIAELNGELGDHEITAAYELEIVTRLSGEMMGQEIDEEESDSGIMVEIDGDGWYVWDVAAM